VGGIVVQQIDKDFFINGQMFWGLAMVLSSLVYVIVSLLTGRGRREFDMDRLLRRGSYAVAGETAVVEAAPLRGWKVLGMGREFTAFDKVIYIATYAWTLSWVIVFAVGTAVNLAGAVGDAGWMAFWKTYTRIYLAASVVIIVWFSTGGLRDLGRMIATLKTMTRDHADDGFVPSREPER